MKAQDAEPYLSDEAQQTVDAIAQRAARDVIHALNIKDETTTWQLVRKTLRAPLAVAYDEGSEAVRRS